MPLSVDQLSRVRRMTGDNDSSFWTDTQLQNAAEAFNVAGVYDLRALSASLWEEKAATWSVLVQTSESGSSRAAQQQFDHAIVMAKRFKEDAGVVPVDPNTLFPRSTRVVRAVKGA